MAGSRGKVLVAMSGGVDSSVAAALLLEQGFDVVGCFMRLGSPGEELDVLRPVDGREAASSAAPGRALRIGHQGCCSITDAADARLVAAQLGIPFYVCNFKKDFGRIIDYFVDEYASGRTPNPCVRCNDWLKFGKLAEYAAQIGADFVASGHYARVERSEGGAHALRRGLDHAKDQSYVLFGVPREHLPRMLLPIGAMHKPAVREHARRLGLPVFDKPDSQEICFVPDNDYAGLVERRLAAAGTPAQAGAIVDESGAVVGAHAGQHRFTIGQRRGLGVALGRPLYVLGRDPVANTVTVGDAAGLRVNSCTVGEANWLADPAELRGPVLVKFRSKSEPVEAAVMALDDGAAATPSGRRGRFAVRFAQEQLAVSPGQALVVYGGAGGDTVLGGGWIEAVERAGL